MCRVDVGDHREDRCRYKERRIRFVGLGDDEFAGARAWRWRRCFELPRSRKWGQIPPLARRAPARWGVLPCVPATASLAQAHQFASLIAARTTGIRRRARRQHFWIVLADPVESPPIRRRSDDVGMAGVTPRAELLRRCVATFRRSSDR